MASESDVLETAREIETSGRHASERSNASETDALLGNGAGEIEDGHEPAPMREQWNHPPVNRYRYASANTSLFILGLHDGSIGALIPHLERYYSVGYATVSTMFLASSIGYITAALCNNWIHHKVGQRGIAFFGPVSKLVGYIPLALHPPFPVIPVLLVFTGLGNGFEDSAYNAWVGNLHQANELLGIMHGLFGLGALIAPLVVSAMVAKLHLEWYTYFYVIVTVVCVELVFGVWAFWGATGAAHRQSLRRDGAGSQGVTTGTVLTEPIVWLVAIFLFGYVGVEVSLGGWIPTFMIQKREADDFLAGVTATLFWLGLSLGRVVLGFITGRIGERMAITGYLVLSVVLELLYWLVPNMVGAMVFVTLLGFFLGPLFPAAIVVATRLLPIEYHVTAIGFTTAFGGAGSAVLPFVVGAIAETQGVQVLQPIVIGVLVFLIGIWLSLPEEWSKGKRQGTQ
ncbi:hypothetical protein HIM_01641 [Hirsutella minnesotensis 3608]|nr:hypothetical protein HIM_01641 [Hirsutella minnesotensis 3608]